MTQMWTFAHSFPLTLWHKFAQSKTVLSVWKSCCHTQKQKFCESSKNSWFCLVTWFIFISWQTKLPLTSKKWPQRCSYFRLDHRNISWSKQVSYFTMSSAYKSGRPGRRNTHIFIMSACSTLCVHIFTYKEFAFKLAKSIWSPIKLHAVIYSYCFSMRGDTAITSVLRMRSRYIQFWMFTFNANKLLMH